jgi:hypothetical protein
MEGRKYWMGNNRAFMGKTFSTLLQRYHGRGGRETGTRQGRLFLIVTTTLPTLSFTTDYSRKLPERKKG